MSMSEEFDIGSIADQCEQPIAPLATLPPANLRSQAVLIAHFSRMDTQRIAEFETQLRALGSARYTKAVTPEEIRFYSRF